MSLTYGPCPRCWRLTRSVERTTTGHVVTHFYGAVPCPTTPGELPVLTRRAVA